MSIAVLRDPREAEAWSRGRRALGRTLGLVPTMGALHEGHLALVRRSVEDCGATCVSVFVNPLQFDQARDFERYPRDFEGDARLLAGAGCDMVFTGTLEQFFPGETLDGRRVRSERLEDPGPCAEGLEGAHRPGHFRGVATIVRRLFEIVGPDRAYFGAKDFQQTLVVADLARRLGGPEIRRSPTEREPSGLARSSRNELLAPADRERAAALYAALLEARAAWRAGERDPGRLAREVAAPLTAAGIDVDYAEVRDPERWTADAPPGPLERAVALVAARLGGVRLIDNLRLDEG